MKPRRSLLSLGALLLPICCSLGRAAGPPKVVITKQVDPDWGSLTSGYLLEQREINLTVDSGGEPYAIQAKTAIPDTVIRALMQWRFQNGNFVASFKIPVRVPLTPVLERAQSPRWVPTASLFTAQKQASELDAAGAAQLLAHLPNADEPDNPRAVLLLYYAGKGASDPGAAQARRDLILLLARV